LKPKPPLSQEVGAKAARKLARGACHTHGLVRPGHDGADRLVGAIPTLLGAALGLWLDRRYPGGHSWTLALLVVGLAIGCLNAWHWVAKEDKAMRDEQEDGDE
jgi:ATP synthase protein I